MEVTVVDTTKNFFSQGMNLYAQSLPTSNVNLEQALANAANKKAPAAPAGTGQDSVNISPQAYDLAKGTLAAKVFSKEESAQIIEKMKPSEPLAADPEWLEEAQKNIQEALDKKVAFEVQQAEQQAKLEAQQAKNWASSSEGRARAREEAEGIDGSALESPILSTGELAGPVSVTTKNGTKVDIFSRSSDQGQNALFAALSFSDGTQQEFELRHNTVFSEDENGNMFMFVNDDDELLGSEGDDIIINLSAGRVSANGGNDTVLNLYNNVESVEGGSGDDTIYAGNLNRASVNGGQGNDTFVASYTSSSSSIDMGDGDDTVQVRNLESSVNLGNGHNTLRAATFGTGSLGDKKEFTISGGDGNDVISIGAMGSVGGRHNIDVGEGDNTLNIKSIGFSSATQIRAGNGNNTVAVDSMEARNRPGAGDVLSLGNGNNNVHIGSLSGFTSMTLGNGNNTMSIDKMSESLVVGMEIDGKYMVSRMAYEFVFGDGNNDFNVTKLLQSRVRFGNGANTITGDSIEHSIISASDTSIYEKPKQHGRIEYPV